LKSEEVVNAARNILRMALEKENSNRQKTLPVDCGEVTLAERPLGLIEARSPDLRGGSHTSY